LAARRSPRYGEQFGLLSRGRSVFREGDPPTYGRPACGCRSVGTRPCLGHQEYGQPAGPSRRRHRGTSPKRGSSPREPWRPAGGAGRPAVRRLTAHRISKGESKIAAPGASGKAVNGANRLKCAVGRSTVAPSRLGQLDDARAAGACSSHAVRLGCRYALPPGPLHGHLEVRPAV
jgi:hypothetical protein